MVSKFDQRVDLKGQIGFLNWSNLESLRLNNTNLMCNLSLKTSFQK